MQATSLDLMIRGSRSIRSSVSKLLEQWFEEWIVGSHCAVGYAKHQLPVVENAEEKVLSVLLGEAYVATRAWRMCKGVANDVSALECFRNVDSDVDSIDLADVPAENHVASLEGIIEVRNEIGG